MKKNWNQKSHRAFFRPSGNRNVHPPVSNLYPMVRAHDIPHRTRPSQLHPLDVRCATLPQASLELQEWKQLQEPSRLRVKQNWEKSRHVQRWGSWNASKQLMLCCWRFSSHKHSKSTKKRGPLPLQLAPLQVQAVPPDKSRIDSRLPGFLYKEAPGHSK